MFCCDRCFSGSEAERVACSFDEHASILTSPVRADTPNVSYAHPREVILYELTKRTGDPFHRFAVPLPLRKLLKNPLYSGHYIF